MHMAAFLRVLLGVASAAPLRVAYLHQGLRVGGIESSLINLCRNVDRARIEPTLVLFGRDPGLALAGDAAAARCAVDRFPARWRGADGGIEVDEFEIGRIVGFLRRRRFDVAFTFFGGVEAGEAVPVGVRAGAAAGLPVITRAEWVVPVPPDLPIAAVEVSSPFVARIQMQRGVGPRGIPTDLRYGST